MAARRTAPCRFPGAGIGLRIPAASRRVPATEPASRGIPAATCSSATTAIMTMRSIACSVNGTGIVAMRRYASAGGRAVSAAAPRRVAPGAVARPRAAGTAGRAAPGGRHVRRLAARDVRGRAVRRVLRALQPEDLAASPARHAERVGGRPRGRAAASGGRPALGPNATFRYPASGGTGAIGRRWRHGCLRHASATARTSRASMRSGARCR